MPTNQVEVTWSPAAGLDAKLWDGAGAEHDITSVFEAVKAENGVGKNHAKIVLDVSGTDTTLEFTPVSSETKVGVSSALVDQILQAL